MTRLVVSLLLAVCLCAAQTYNSDVTVRGKLAGDKGTALKILPDCAAVPPDSGYAGLCAESDGTYNVAAAGTKVRLATATEVAAKYGSGSDAHLNSLVVAAQAAGAPLITRTHANTVPTDPFTGVQNGSNVFLGGFRGDGKVYVPGMADGCPTWSSGLLDSTGEPCGTGAGDNLGTAAASDVAALFSGTGDYLKKDGSTGTPSGAGDVTGPSSSTDGSLTCFDGTTGKQLKPCGDDTAAGRFVLGEAAPGADKITVRAPDSVTANYDLTLPAAAPTGVLYANAGEMATATGANIGAAFSGTGEYLKKDGSSGTPSGGTNACIQSGGFYFPYGPPFAATSNAAHPSNTYYHQFQLNCTLTFTKITFWQTAASGTSCSGGTCGAQLAIYGADKARIFATSTMVSGGTPDLNVVTAGNNKKTFTVAQQTLQPGVYYYSLQAEAAPNSMTVALYQSAGSTLGAMLGSSANRRSRQANGGTGNGAGFNTPATITGTEYDMIAAAPVIMFEE